MGLLPEAVAGQTSGWLRFWSQKQYWETQNARLMWQAVFNVKLYGSVRWSGRHEAAAKGWQMHWRRRAPRAPLLQLNSKSDRSEWFDILDPSDTRTIIGKKLRKEVHRDGDWHRAVHVWLFRSTDRSVLLQLRSAQKDTHPLCWDVSAAGHLQSGEHDLLAAAKRELEEELGMTDSEPELLFEVYSENLGQDIRDREVQSVYVVRLPQVTVSAGRNVTEEAAQQPVFRLQEEEVVQVRWMPITDYLAALEQRQAGYVPRPPAYIKQLRAALGKI